MGTTHSCLSGSLHQHHFHHLHVSSALQTREIDAARQGPSIKRRLMIFPRLQRTVHQYRCLLTEHIIDGERCGTIFCDRETQCCGGIERIRKVLSECELLRCGDHHFHCGRIRELPVTVHLLQPVLHRAGGARIDERVRLRFIYIFLCTSVFRFLKTRCIAASDGTTSVQTYPNCESERSLSRFFPFPNRTGATARCISSTSPACRY